MHAFDGRRFSVCNVVLFLRIEDQIIQFPCGYVFVALPADPPDPDILFFLGSLIPGDDRLEEEFPFWRRL